MTYIMVILILLSGFCFVKSFFSKRVFILTIMLWSLIGMLFSLFFIISITSNYSTAGYIFGNFDRNMFMSIVKNRLNYFTIVRIFNLCAAAYLLTMLLFARSYLRSKSISRRRYIFSVLEVVLLLLYTLFYDPRCALMQHAYAADSHSAFTVLCVIDLMFHIMVYIYLLTPFYRLYRAKKNISSIYKKRQLIGVAIYLLITDTVYLFIVNISSLRTLYLTLDSSIINVRVSAVTNKAYLGYIMILALIIMLFYISSSFNIIRKEGIFYDKILDKIIKKSNKQIIQTFHSFKNILYSYTLTLSRIRQTSGDEQTELIDKLNSDMCEYLNRITSALNLQKGINDFWTDKVYLSDIVDDALKNLQIPDGIELVRDYKERTEIIYADSFYLTEAIYNIIQNAVSAIEEAHRISGLLTISIRQEYEWIVLAISDNGVGMTRKQMRNIFKEFYTTKTRIDNWGIGLAFSKRILKYHHGNISLKSKPGIGTTFYVLLPDDFEAWEN